MIAERAGMLWLTSESEEDSEAIERLKKKCTVDHPAWVNATKQGYSTEGIPRYAKFFVESQERNAVGFPRALRWESAVDDRMLRPPGREFPQKFVPREGQAEAIDVAVGHLELEGGGVLQAKCGAGKTVMGVEIIRRAKARAVVLVHKDFLMRQWTAEAEKFMPGCKVGIIREDRADTGHDCDVVVAMVQSLLARDYGAKVYESFGLLVADEVHRHSAPEWNKAIGMFPAAMRLGLTATPERPDGLHHLVYAHIGPIFYKMAVKPVDTRLGVRYPQWEVDPRKYVLPWNRKPNMAKLVNALVDIEARTDMIVGDVFAAVEHGRRPIVLTGRRDHVDQIVRKLAVRGVWASRFMGGMDAVEQEHACEADVIVGTFPMAKEGLDVPDRDTLFLATPVGDVEQAIGRIQREYDAKKQPLVVDYVDRKVWLCQALYKSRCRTYAKLNLRRDP